jgi:hypothetical protein
MADLFKWVGRKKREEGWMKEPRRIPDYAKDLKDAQRWVMTREFVNSEDKNLRVYLAAWQPDPNRQQWDIVEVNTDLKSGRFDATEVNFRVEDPVQVVRALADFEQRYKANAAYTQHEDWRSTYRPFANKFGIHFDDNGRIIHVDKEAPLTKGTLMNSEALDKLFRNDKKVALDSWKGLYEGLVNKVSPEWLVTEQVFGVAEEIKDALKIELAANQPAEAWTPPPPTPAPPPQPEPEPLSPSEANRALDGLKSAFNKAASADTGPAQSVFRKLRDQFTRVLDETTRRSDKPSAQVLAEVAPLINNIFNDTMGDIMEAAMKDNRAMDTFQALVNDVTEETRTLKNSVPRKLQADLPDALKNGIKPNPEPQADAPKAESPETGASNPAADPAQPQPAATDAAAPEAAPKPEAPVTPAAAPEAAPPALIDGKTVAELAKEQPYANVKHMQLFDVTRIAQPADLAKDPAYAEYAEVTRLMIDQLKRLPTVLLSKTATPEEKSAIASFQYAVQGQFGEGRQELAQHEAAATALVGLLRAGVELFAEQFKPGKVPSPEGLQMVKRIGEACVQLAVNHLGVAEDDAKNISKIIASGRDPFGPELPLEKIFSQFPPPAVEREPEPKKAPPPPRRSGVSRNDW